MSHRKTLTLLAALVAVASTTGAALAGGGRAPSTTEVASIGPPGTPPTTEPGADALIDRSADSASGPDATGSTSVLDAILAGVDGPGNGPATTVTTGATSPTIAGSNGNGSNGAGSNGNGSNGAGSAAPPVHDTVPGAGTPPAADEPGDPIGGFGDDGPVPPGLGLVAPPKPPKHLGPVGPGGLAVAPSCSHRCITKGVAHPRGFGALIEVETTVPAKLFLSVVADLDDNGTYEDTHVETTPHGVQHHEWALDHLEPGQTYYGMVAATDEHGHVDYAWGEFTTLAHRDVIVELGATEIVGGPGDITDTDLMFGLATLPLRDMSPGVDASFLFPDLPRWVNVDLWVLRGWDPKHRRELCEVWMLEGSMPQGHDESSCLAWNSTTEHAVDLDAVPADRSRWTQSSVALTLHSPTEAGGGLPAGYGDPYHFAFSTPVTLHVIYR